MPSLSTLFGAECDQVWVVRAASFLDVTSLCSCFRVCKKWKEWFDVNRESLFESAFKMSFPKWTAVGLDHTKLMYGNDLCGSWYALCKLRYVMEKYLPERSSSLLAPSSLDGPTFWDCTLRVLVWNSILAAQLRDDCIVLGHILEIGTMRNQWTRTVDQLYMRELPSLSLWEEYARRGPITPTITQWLVDACHFCGSGLALGRFLNRHPESIPHAREIMGTLTTTEGAQQQTPTTSTTTTEATATTTNSDSQPGSDITAHSKVTFLRGILDQIQEGTRL
ncbi:hypothetical protein Pelo_14421 [Pelomyxa schiedti]|nr:hypothetical protein Pelo_14421 [Pelomyxa schiedti]